MTKIIKIQMIIEMVFILYYLIIMSLLSAIDWNCLTDDSRHILNTLKGYIVNLFREASIVDKITDNSDTLFKY